MVDMVEETVEQKLRRHEDALTACMAEITRLREENAKLRAEKGDALSVLREFYNDESVSPAHRIKAAGLCLPHEVPRLTPVAPAIDSTCEEVEDLATLVSRRRARQDQLEGRPIEVTDAGVRVLPKPGSNGSADDSDSGDQS